MEQKPASILSSCFWIKQTFMYTKVAEIFIESCSKIIYAKTRDFSPGHQMKREEEKKQHEKYCIFENRRLSFVHNGSLNTTHDMYVDWGPRGMSEAHFKQTHTCIHVR